MSSTPTTQRPSLPTPHALTLRQLRQIAPLYIIVRLHEDLAQARLADGVVLEVELVEAVKRVRVRVHVERVDREVVRGQLQRLEHLLQRQRRAVTENHDVLPVGQRMRGTNGGRTFGLRLILDLINRSRCFWFMLLE